MKRLISCLLCICMLLCCPSPGAAAEDGVIRISEREDMRLLCAHPDGSFELTNDIDMTGDWTPVLFSGRLNGNGHTLYNLTVRAPGADTVTTFDGNYIEYETVLGGLFSALTNAEITDLHLVNAVIDIETDRHCFTGAFAGYAADSVLTGCSAQVRSHLTVSSVNAGVGGLVGFSVLNVFEHCSADAELVFTDVNPDTPCEAFMGGVYASGSGNVKNCDVRMRGFAEIYGYAHNGGVIGMIKPPRERIKMSYLTNTAVDAEISFFEIAPARRAYCKALIGENRHGQCKEDRNKVVSFVHSESREPVRLSPERCEAPQYNAVVTPYTHTEWGYTTYTCAGCGYSYRDAYTPPGHTYTVTRTEPTCTEDGGITYTCIACGETHTDVLPAAGHVPGEWTVIREPAILLEGLMQQTCTVCGAVLETRAIPALPEILTQRIVLSAESLELHCGERATLSASVLPETVTVPGIVYLSSDPSVASVSADGTVTAQKRGTAVITAASVDGGASETCTVTVSFTVGQWIRYYILFGWLKGESSVFPADIQQMVRRA